VDFGDGLLGAPFEMVAVVMVLGEEPCSAGFVDRLSSVLEGLT
jgi:formaldehyde-activating enzyme involved in methanogenesis